MKWTRRKRRGKSTIRVYDGSKLAHSLEPPVIKNNNRLTYLRNLHYPDTEPVADATRNKKKVDVALRSTKKKSVQVGTTRIPLPEQYFILHIFCFKNPIFVFHFWLEIVFVSFRCGATYLKLSCRV
uniref:Uncharacterized protein n=1 Tax=Aegilops tauschii subsp. strangulata TaxID=200361 RepID=A0A453HX71_AEGTS